MTRNKALAAIAVVVGMLLVVFVFVSDYPADEGSMTGTMADPDKKITGIEKAKRDRTEQITDADVQLDDASFQILMQNDDFLDIVMSGQLALTALDRVSEALGRETLNRAVEGGDFFRAATELERQGVSEDFGRALERAGLERMARADLERMERADLERMARADLDRMARTDLERMSRADLERLARGDLERMARGDLERMARVDLERMARTSLERMAKTDLERMERADLERMARANFERASFDRSSLERAAFERALERAGLDRAELERAGLDRASLDRMNLERVDLDRAELARGLERAGLQRADLERAGFDRAALNRAVTDMERATAEFGRADMERAAGLFKSEQMRSELSRLSKTDGLARAIDGFYRSDAARSLERGEELGRNVEGGFARMDWNRAGELARANDLGRGDLGRAEN